MPGHLPIDRESIKYGLIFGLIASLLNVFALVPIYGQLTFHLGQAFVILCLIVRGFKAALIAGTISIIVLTISIDNNYFFLLLMLELCTLYWLRKKGIAILFGAVIYWGIIGIPLSYLIISTQTNFPFDYTILVLMKQLINGVLYTLIASILLIFTPFKYIAKTFKSTLPTMASRIFYLTNLSIILPALLVALVFSSRATSEFQMTMRDDLFKSANQISVLISNYLENHLKVVQNLAKTIPHSEDKTATLTHTQATFPGFITMLIADKDGAVKTGAPASFYENFTTLPKAQQTVKDRSYFVQPKQTGEDYVSDVFRGLGFGDDIIVAISSPLNDSEGFNGIIEGSLNLPGFHTFEQHPNNSGIQHALIVTDKQNNVIYASEAISLPMLEEFSPQAAENIYSQQMQFTRINDIEYLYMETTNQFGWKTFVLTKPDAMTRIFNENLYILAFGIIIISAAFMVVTRKFTRQLTEPLESLTQIFSHESKSTPESKHHFNTAEVRAIAEQLKDAKFVMDAFNQQLENQVNSKTAELSALNKELEKLARQDELTDLANRRAFDDQAGRVFEVNARNKQQMTLVGIDIDHFKNINDTYGHPFGDKCITGLAENIKRHFNRASDICARYGGEEFVLLLAGGNCFSHLKQLEYFRQAVENTQLLFEEQPVKFTVSIGAVCIKEEFDLSFDVIMKQADNLLYRSKENGRNQITHEFI